MKVLVWLTHSFRVQSRIFSRGTASNEVSFVYYSPHYYDDDIALMHKNSCVDIEYWFKYSLSAFSLSAKAGGYDIHCFKQEDPISHINRLIEKHKYEKVLIDKPLFNFPNNIDVSKINAKIEFVDSDLYDEKCKHLDVDKRVKYWLESYKEYLNVVSPTWLSKNIKLKDDGLILMGEDQVLELLSEDRIVESFVQRMIDYKATKKHPDGTFRISGHLHHGQVDAGALVLQILVASLYDRVSGETWHLEPLRQLAKREIAIIRARSFNLQPYDDVLDWAEHFLDKKSYYTLVESSHEKIFNRHELLNGTTADPDIDMVVRKLKEELWLHPELRKWLAIEVYWGMGGGIEALESLLELFNVYSIDGQSPNNMINCVSTFQLQDGMPEKIDTEELFKRMNL